MRFCVNLTLVWCGVYAMKRLDKYLVKRTHIDEDGNQHSEDVMYKAFPTYDAQVFLDTFYSHWVPDGVDGQAKFRLCSSTAYLLEAMKKLYEIDCDFYEVKSNCWGRPSAIGDKTMYRATQFVAKAVDAALFDLESQKAFSNMMFRVANTKKEQDYALDYLMDKMEEEKALNDAIDKSITERVIFRKEDRKEILMDYFEGLKSPKKDLSKQAEQENVK